MIMIKYIIFIAIWLKTWVFVFIFINDKKKVDFKESQYVINWFNASGRLITSIY